MARLLAKALLRFDPDSMTLSVVRPKSPSAPELSKVRRYDGAPDDSAHHDYVLLKQTREKRGLPFTPEQESQLLESLDRSQSGQGI